MDTKKKKKKKKKKILTQSHTLANTNQHTATDEAAQVMVRRKGLHKRSNHRDEAADTHAGTAAKVVGHGAGKEKSRDDGTDGVCRIDEADEVRVFFLFCVREGGKRG